MATYTGGCGAPTCNPRDISLKLFQERGRISETIWERIASGNPFLRALEKTKKPFESGMGDTMNRRILNVHNPRETDVLGWTRVGGATPGQSPTSPCCITYKEIPYGDSFVSACLYQDGWMTPTFCIADLVFKHQWEKVIQQFTETMANWTRGVWEMWSVVGFQRSVQCMTLNSVYGLPENLGTYPTAAPTSVLSFQHCEEIYMRLRGEGASLSSAVPGYELIFIGTQQFRKMEYDYLASAAALGHRSVSGAVSASVPSLGHVKVIDKYMFVEVPYPRRFRARASGETWEDCIIPHSLYEEGTHGSREVRNPDYYNRDIALYEEVIFYNMAAAEWLTPPEPLSTGLGNFLKPQNYSGEFILFNQPTDCDPKAKNGRFYADYMSGMIANFPKRARCVMALAQHNAAVDVCPEGCMGAPAADPMKYYVLDCAKLLGESTLQILVKGTIPDTCPDGSSLFAVDRGGNKFIIDTVVATEPWAGDSINTEGGTLVQFTFPTALAAAATCRSECDGWDYIACLPSTTPSSDPTEAGCQGCSPNTVSDVCTFTSEFDSVDGPLSLKDSGGNELVAFSFADPDAPTAAEAAADIQTYLDANGGGTATVTLTDFHWTIVVTGAAGTAKTKLTGAEVTYDGGQGYPDSAVVQTGDCA